MSGDGIQVPPVSSAITTAEPEEEQKIEVTTNFNVGNIGVGIRGTGARVDISTDKYEFHIGGDLYDFGAPGDGSDVFLSAGRTFDIGKDRSVEAGLRFIGYEDPWVDANSLHAYGSMHLPSGVTFGGWVGRGSVRPEWGLEFSAEPSRVSPLLPDSLALRTGESVTYPQELAVIRYDFASFLDGAIDIDFSAVHDAGWGVNYRVGPTLTLSDVVPGVGISLVTQLARAIGGDDVSPFVSLSVSITP